MKKPIPPLKIVALVSSVCLVGAYVTYRVVSARSAEPTHPAQAAPAAPDPDPDAFLGGSKSELIFRPGEEGMDADYSMRGSKTMVPIFESKDLETPEQKKAKEKKKEAP